MTTPSLSAPPTLLRREVALGLFERMVLMSGCAGVIALCYFFALGTMAVLLFVLACEAVAFVALLRFGMAGFVLARMQRHFPLLTIFARSLFLGKHVAYRVPLRREDAPELHAMIEDVSRHVGVPVPREVCIEMGAGAWVELNGWFQNSKNTVLGVGYDLLAALDEVEVRAVIAHEMVHARLVRRGLKKWLNRGLGRSVALTRGFADETSRYREKREKLWLGEQLLRVSHRLTLWGVRMVSAFSRQDEFDADRGATLVCGARPLRSSLQRLEAIAPRLMRLPWNERVSRLQGTQSFSGWLMEELGRYGAEIVPPGLQEEGTDEYSTHPSLGDRIAALPAVAEFACPRGRCGLLLLAEPDRIARDLVAEIQRVQLKQEETDDRQLDRWARRQWSRGKTRLLQWPGLLLVVGAVLVLIVATALAVMERSWDAAGVSILALAGAAFGMWLYRLGRYRDGRSLPIPAFSRIAASLREECDPESLKSREAELEKAFEELAAGELTKPARVRRLLQESHAALEQADFLRAFVAARRALDIDGKHIESALAFSVGCGALGLGEPLGTALTFLSRQTAFASPSLQWGTGWALAMIGDWSHAEAMLRRVHAKHPDQPTFVAMLALTQWRRGKYQQAMANARRACGLSPDEMEMKRLLIGILIDAGEMTEAMERLAHVPAVAMEDPDFMLNRLRLALLQHQKVEAEKWTQVLRAHEKASGFLVRVAEAHENARQDEMAVVLYQEALSNGHYPQALLGLSRIALLRHEKDSARAYALAALDTEKTPPKGAVGVFPLVNALLAQLTQTEEPQRGLRAWMAVFGRFDLPESLRERAVMVYARDYQEARALVKAVVAAMHPSLNAFKESPLTLEAAPFDQQPVGLCRRGVQYVIR